MTVFVVEDDELITHVLVHLLEREGYYTRCFVDGKAFEVAIGEATDVPGMVLLDVMLPYLDGFELVQRMRARQGWAQVPIIMLSAKSQDHEIVRALDAGANDYIVKPFQPNELMARLRRFLRVKGGA
ncbi:MAG: response regulator transcription factor [Telluria sp.]